MVTAHNYASSGIGQPAGSRPAGRTFIFAVVLVMAASIGMTVPVKADNRTAEGDEAPPFIYRILPGGTHFYEGNYCTGIAVSFAEVSLLTTGLLIEDRLGTDGQTEWNLPSIFAQQIYIIDGWRDFQNRHLRSRRRHPGATETMQIDKTPFSQLLWAPFNPRIFTKPYVLSFAALGVGIGIVEYHLSGRHYRNISSVTAISTRMSRAGGTAYYEGASLALSYGTAVSEEMIFRGMLMPFLDFKWGKVKGLWGSSVIFGGLHLLNPDVKQPLMVFAVITAGGPALGWNVQKNDYRLREVIAAHFWYDLIILTSAWIADPENNPLGIKVELEF